MSLLSAPLDYTSATTNSVLQGIDNTVKMAGYEAAQKKKQQEQTSQRVASIEQNMSKMRGSADALTPRQRQVFGAYYVGYRQMVDAYSNDPTQENLNRIFETIGSLESYLNLSTGQYVSDKKSLAEVYEKPGIASEGVQGVNQNFMMRHGDGGVFSSVEFDPKTLSVVVTDPEFGVGDRTIVQEHPMYTASGESLLLYTPKVNAPNYISSQAYGSSKAGLYDVLPSTERKGKFSSTANIELVNNQQLMYSAVLEKAAKDGLTEVDPLVMLTDQNYADWRSQAVQEYIDNGYVQTDREIKTAAGRRSQATTPFSGQSIAVNVNNKSTDIPLLKSPIKLIVDENIGTAEAQARNVTIDGFQVLPNASGLAVREVRQQAKYYNKGTGQEVTDPNQISTLAISGNLTKTENPIFTTRIITDPQEYAGMVTALKRAELIK